MTDNKERVADVICRLREKAEVEGPCSLATLLLEAADLLDALELLKEQEPVKPRYEDYFGNRIARCGYCNGYIVRYKYCPGCGKAVKWE